MDACSGRKYSRPKVSVIVPVYNAEKYFRECMDSVLNQTLKDIEVILVDDVSTDNSPEMCDRFAADDKRVRVLHLSENGGPGIARNAGIDIAEGEYITFMDADDKAVPDAFEKMFCFASDNNLDIVRCEVGMFTDKCPEPEHVFHYYGERSIFTKREDLDRIAVCVFSTPIRSEHRNMNFGGSVWSAMFHRSLFDKGGVRFPDIPHMMCEDFIFCYDTARKAKSFGLIPEVLFHYRLNINSRTNAPREDLLLRAFSTGCYMEDLLRRDGYAEEYQEYALRFVIDTTRAYLKNFFLSPIPRKELKRWFYSEKTCSPILDRAYRSFPLELLPFRHRINFLAFYKKRFWLLYFLIRLRELIR